MRNYKDRYWDIKYNLAGGDRPPAEYKHYFGEDADDVSEGDWILEIGPGKTEKWARHLRNLGASVVTMGPHYEDSALKQISDNLNRTTGKTVHAINNIPESGPLASDNTYKKIYGLFSTPAYTSDTTAVVQAFENMINALAVGGKGYFYPVDQETIDLLSMHFYGKISIDSSQKIGRFIFTKMKT